MLGRFGVFLFHFYQMRFGWLSCWLCDLVCQDIDGGFVSRRGVSDCLKQDIPSGLQLGAEAGGEIGDGVLVALSRK